MKQISLQGDRLRLERTKKCIKAKDLANKCGISAGYLSQLESGKRDQPPDDLVKKLALELSVSPEWLMGDDAKANAPVRNIGSVGGRELLYYRTAAQQWLEKEAIAHAAEIPKCVTLRQRLGVIGKAIDILVELQERCVDEWTGKKRGENGTREN